MRTTVSLQYAKALFDLAKEENRIDEYASYLNMAGKIFIDDSNTYRVFNHPAISNEERKKIIENSLKEYVTNTFLNYLKVLVDNNRLIELKDIFDSYQGLLDDYHHQCNVLVYVKYELSEEDKKQLVIALETKLNKKVNLITKIDNSLIGGMKVVVDGKIMDASIKYKMLDLKNELKKGW